MDAQFKRVIESILTAESEPATCKQYRLDISAYIEAELAGEHPEAQYSELAQHLETCPDCYEDYMDLRRLLTLEQEGQLEEPPRPGQFDFSFLEEAPAQPSLWETTEENVRRLATDVTAQLGEKLVALGDLSEMLMPYRRLTPAPTTLRTKDMRTPSEEDLTEVLELPVPEAEMRIKLLMGPVQQDQGTIMVQVEDLESLQPLSRVRVILRDQEKHLLEGSPTDPDGTVTFKRLKVGQYVIEVRRDDTRWELSLDFEEG